MGSFDIKGGHGGAFMGCRHCEAELERDPKTGNYFCPTPGCGKGSLSASNGITTTVDGDGNMTLVAGKPS